MIHDSASYSGARLRVTAPVRWLALLVLCTPLWGCRSIPPPGDAAHELAPTPSAATTNRSVTVVDYTPRQPRCFSRFQKFNPVWWFGNADDPVAPDWYRPGKRCRNTLWHMRNPCHNFTFYVMGIADKPHTRAGRFPDKTANPQGGWNWAVSRYKCLRLPFVSYQRGKFGFYFGWRTRGNFGLKLSFTERPEPATPQPPGPR